MLPGEETAEHRNISHVNQVIRRILTKGYCAGFCPTFDLTHGHFKCIWCHGKMNPHCLSALMGFSLCVIPKPSGRVYNDLLPGKISSLRACLQLLESIAFVIVSFLKTRIRLSCDHLDHRGCTTPWSGMIGAGPQQG